MEFTTSNVVGDTTVYRFQVGEAVVAVLYLFELIQNRNPLLL